MKNGGVILIKYIKDNRRHLGVKLKMCTKTCTEKNKIVEAMQNAN